MTLDEANKEIKHHNNQIEVSRLALEKLFVIREKAREVENGQMTIDEIK